MDIYFDGRCLDVLSPAGRGQLVIMLITLEPQGIFGSNCILASFNIVQPLD